MVQYIANERLRTLIDSFVAVGHSAPSPIAPYRILLKSSLINESLLSGLKRQGITVRSTLWLLPLIVFLCVKVLASEESLLVEGPNSQSKSAERVERLDWPDKSKNEFDLFRRMAAQGFWK